MEDGFRQSWCKSSVITSKQTKEMEKACRRKKEGCGRMLGTFDMGVLWVSMETVDLNAWVHEALLPGVPYCFGGQKITFPWQLQIGWAFFIMWCTCKINKWKKESKGSLVLSRAKCLYSLMPARKLELPSERPQLQFVFLTIQGIRTFNTAVVFWQGEYCNA